MMDNVSSRKVLWWIMSRPGEVLWCIMSRPGEVSWWIMSRPGDVLCSNYLNIRKTGVKCRPFNPDTNLEWFILPGNLISSEYRGVLFINSPLV